MASIFKQAYTMKNKSDKRVRKKSKFWYVDYKDADGARKRTKGFRDKAATIQLAAELEKKAELARAGIVDRYAEDRKKPLKHHLEDFYQALLAKGDTIKHAQQTKYRAEQIINGCKFTVWTDISASKVQRQLADLRNNENGISAQTSNYYLQSMKQFCLWMVRDGRANESPVTHLTKINAKIDRRHDRRALEPNEVRRLIEATGAAPRRFGMAGPERAMLYRLAIETGLRANELRSLKVSSFDFEKCIVTVQAAYSKHRRQDEVPLRPNTADALKTFLEGKMPSAKAFCVPDKPVNMFRKDLEDAKIQYVDDSGRYADFHCLRHTTGSLLAASGVHPKIAQILMRHCDINLTMNRYTHSYVGQITEALTKLPDFSLPSRESLRASGTDNKVVETDSIAYKKLTKKTYFDGHSASPIGTSNELKKQKDGEMNTVDKSLHMTHLGTEKEPMSPGDIDPKPNAPGRTRTSNLRIRSPRLQKYN